MTFGIRLHVTRIKIPVYVSLGPMAVRRDALEPEHPENRYNWVKREIGIDPEDFGIFNAETENK